MAGSSKFVIHNGVVSPPSDTPTLSTFLASHPGAYTTTRTHNNGKLILFWERHLRRLANSARILFNTNPKLLFESGDHLDPFSIPLMQSLRWESVVQTLVNDNLRQVLPIASNERKSGEELSITTLVSGSWEKLRGIGNIDDASVGRAFDVYVHLGMYVPAVFGIRENGAHLAMVGRGRDVAEAKYSDWVRLRKPLESLRPPSATELMLSNDGDRILEGSVTNFFVVCCKGKDIRNVEVQTAPIGDGVLPGVIRQVVIDICSRIGIPVREVAPSWSQHGMWEEAFITSSLRLLQHVNTIQVPSPWLSLQSRSSENVTWAEKQFEAAPGRITAVIQDIYDGTYSFEIRAVPIGDGVLPGVICQVKIDTCSRNGIPLREVAPSWSQQGMWEEAFITSSLRLLQHLNTIQVPSQWLSLQSRSSENVTWAEKQFEVAPGRITAQIRRRL